ncbi:hypothetical protein ACFST9_22635 [Hymenobacter monticola]|uniref:Auto-transporter adhesin head GIN domain-containing protein n=1 Tax=Hymenobacter monticola TaxID=1705399 RepID=A0ABY4B4P0_9BACT|nr:hypothetical protein [Hymenobacter monticola]UOE34103.1 hypothetical protein MTP16_00275 [Hymenobacter monticola]
MKTSNKWLLAALLLLLGSLTAYNMGLRAEFRKGAYKDPNRNTVALNFKDFTEIDLQAANVVGLKVVAGPYSVRLNKAAEKYVKVTQQGQRLRIALVFPEGRESVGRQTLTISLPRLAKLSASGTYLMNGKPVTDKQYAGQSLRIEGFRQDSLTVQQDHGTLVELARNQLGFLRAEAGHSPGSHPQLRIEKSNRIAAAYLNVQNEGQLQLEAGGIANLRTQFGDSARATLTGAGLNNLGQR